MAGGAAAIRMVVNADGFGVRPALDRGVLRAHREGIVTSTSVLGNCPEVGAVRAALETAPRLGVGAHLTLVGGRPLSSPGAIRSLVDASGLFPARASEVFLAWARGTLRGDDVERELDAQVARLRDAGLRLDHLSTHMHLGFLPTVGRAVEAVARRHGIPGVRMAVERPSLGWVAEIPRAVVATALGGLAWLTRRQMGVLRHGPQTWGYVESGQLDEIRILEIVGRLGPGPHELICQPLDDEAPALGGKREIDALTSPLVRETIERRGIRLCRWGDLF